MSRRSCNSICRCRATRLRDALGLRVETVSREIHCLKTSGVIATAGRRKVTVPHLPTLRALAQSDSE